MYDRYIYNIFSNNLLLLSIWLYIAIGEPTEQSAAIANWFKAAVY